MAAMEKGAFETSIGKAWDHDFTMKIDVTDDKENFRISFSDDIRYEIWAGIFDESGNLIKED